MTGALQVTATDIAAIANGFSGLTIGRGTGTAVITVNAVTFKTPVTIGTGSIVLAGNVSDSGNNVTFLSPTTLTANVTVTGALVHFDSTINDTTTAGTQSLTVTGNAQFDGTVGNSLALSTIGVSGTTFINTSAINTSSNQTYSGAATLGANTTLTLTSGLVDFASTLNDTTSAGSQSLTVTGNAEFDGTVGNSLALSTIAVSGTTFINTSAINTSSNQTYTGAATLGANTTLTATSGLVELCVAR